MRIRFTSLRCEVRDSEGAFLVDYLKGTKPPFEDEGYLYATYDDRAGRRSAFPLSRVAFRSRAMAEKAMAEGIEIVACPESEAFAKRCVAAGIATVV